MEADKHYVFVPKDEVDAFGPITDSRYEIRTQESLSSAYRDSLQDATALAGNSVRFGWYLQQFNKIQALQDVAADELIIWDADCVPLRPIKMFTSERLPIFMEASEKHLPYFETIDRLLGLPRIHTHSFVVPGFPIRKAWALEFIDTIRRIHDPLDWADAIISSTDLRLQSGFSETETLGTWISHSHPGEWETSRLSWERKGQSKYGFARDFSTEALIALGETEGIDIVTFENWDLPRLEGGKIGLRALSRRAAVKLAPRWIRSSRRK